MLYFMEVSGAKGVGADIFGRLDGIALNYEQISYRVPVSPQ